ncbi:MAG: hypothetical protein DMD60_05130 [Gemmatimonadetes bacterium]|nr:MAG: hypothetical protein DMD60_05130 [Gemmatimonadota bacterium]
MSDAIFYDGLPIGDGAEAAQELYARLVQQHGTAATALHGETFDAYKQRMLADGKLFLRNGRDWPVDKRLDYWRAAKAAEKRGAIFIDPEPAVTVLSPVAEWLAAAKAQDQRKARELLANPEARAARLAEIEAPARRALPTTIKET